MDKTTKGQSRTAPLARGELARLRSRVAALGGEAKAYGPLEIPRDTLVRALAGASIRPGTAALIRARLEAGS